MMFEQYLELMTRLEPEHQPNPMLAKARPVLVLPAGLRRSPVRCQHLPAFGTVPPGGDLGSGPRASLAAGAGICVTLRQHHQQGNGAEDPGVSGGLRWGGVACAML